MSDIEWSRSNHPSHRRRAGDPHATTPRSSMVISCDECAMQCSSACDDCVVTYVLRSDDDGDEEPLTLDVLEERAVRLLARAGLIPELQYRVAV